MSGTYSLRKPRNNPSLDYEILSSPSSFYLLVHPTLSSKPNVVVFLVDDLGYMDIGANNLTVFTRLLTSINWQRPVCASPMVTPQIQSALRLDTV